MVKLHKIYTKTGDQGTTGIVGPHRLSKHDLRIQAIGSVDESNASIGLCRLYAENHSADTALKRIQNDLFDLGADLAQLHAASEEKENKTLRITATQVTWLETQMDQLNEDLAPLTSFVLPGGSTFSAQLHMARTIVRRAERDMVALHAIAPVNEDALKYVNRLSDYLFVLGRHGNDNGKKDILWTPGENR
ncbi:cob(I)yrinic acid a,c-diamide adenosyltransferase [Alphaproteobacteria bacterium]|nr:cob(I)yrinic acid a,c-diamide adenosyltransferase [Alphaproteobacteria bacterium]